MLTTGIYEQLITELLYKELDKHSEKFYIGNQELQKADAAVYLARFLSSILFRVLDSLPDGDDRIQQQIKLCNALVKWLAEYLKEEEISENLIETRGMLFTAFFSKENPIESDLHKYIARITPQTGLSQSELFTGSNAGLSLESELKKEILSSDEIWWLVSFIKWTGIRVFTDELNSFARSGKKIKVITTSYMGATDVEAVDFLASLPNAEVKLNYNISHERLHAQSYIFRRYNGFDTGYIGSSNISRSALTSGLEWNLKVTSQEIPHILSKFKSTFETYWASPEFEIYNYGDAEHRKRLRQSIKLARGDSTEELPLFFDIEPHVYQKQILEKLIAERAIHNRWRNLVVAATGTGKTVISAFDFRAYYRKKPDARLLFVAHREEILKQARDTFRAILRDSSFGDLWVSGIEPQHYRHLFVSVQTLNNRLGSLRLASDYYDFIIIDEVHHIAADSYRPILSHFSPEILLGLTATPERHDGSDILCDFCGTIAAELRLTDAINRGYLCPFQYFGIEDTVDLTGVKWERGRYLPSELSRIYTANDERVKHIIRNMQNVIGNLNSIKCLGFCVSQDHAEYMTRKFLLSGIKAGILTSKNSEERTVLRQQLQHGDINILFVVDIFNEGVDIPEIDTVLFLRPTESLTIFLQQLGRGLRLAEGKECLTVLDFVGNSRPEYDSTNGWTRFCVQAGVMEDRLDASLEKVIYTAIKRRILQCTSYSYLSFIKKLIKDDFNWDGNSAVENQMAMMVHYDFWQEPGTKLGFSTLRESLKRIGSNRQLVNELNEVIDYLLDRLDFTELEMNIGFETALHIYSRYGRDQILAAFGEHTFERKMPSREGVHEIKRLNIELLFVTLKKSEKKFSPTTMYQDYAISEDLFHWQTQNSAHPDRGKGLSYRNHKKEGKKFILFVREQSNDEYGTMGFVNAGPVEFVTYEGSQPMNITWKLLNPLPSYMWKDSAKLSVG
jgi:superfamily II DNA or RNA helicase/PIN domain nuclease of toxin-antitoxin system